MDWNHSSVRAGMAALLIFILALPSYAQDWQPVAPLPDGFVSNHSFGFALDGMGYLVAGESTGGYSDAFYQYNPSSDGWMAMAPFPSPARGYTIGDTWDGRAWMGFGNSGQGGFEDGLRPEQTCVRTLVDES